MVIRGIIRHKLEVVKMTSDEMFGPVSNLLSKYAWGYDSNQLNLLGECFTEDASLTMKLADGSIVGPFVGRTAIVNLMSESMGTQSDQRRHVTTNLFIESTGAESLHVISTLTLFGSESGQTSLLCTGVNDDLLVRVEGDWLIQSRTLELDAGF